MKLPKFDAVQPTELDGIFVRDISYEQLQSFSKLRDKLEDNEDIEESLDALYQIFNLFICDEEGNTFEDVTGTEDLKKIGVITLRKIMRAVVEAFDIEGKDSTPQD